MDYIEYGGILGEFKDYREGQRLQEGLGRLGERR